MFLHVFVLYLHYNTQFMKLVSHLILVLVAVVSLVSCKSTVRKDGTPKQASIQLDSIDARLGTFPRSASTQSTVFTFTNIGDADLEFLDVDYSCGCVSAVYPEKPVKPGKSGKIVVTYKGRLKKAGKVYQKVYFAVSGKPSNFVLRIHGQMTEN